MLEAKKINKNPYMPEKARIVRKYDLTEDVRFFQIRIINPDLVLPLTSSYKPGQFMMLSIPNVGEAPFSITSTPSRPGVFEFCIRKVGKLTTKLFELKENSVVWLRGPFGNGFPVEQMVGKDLLFVAGGLGVAPLRSLLLYALDNRELFGKIFYLHGARTPKDMLFREEFFRLKERDDFECYLSVDSDPLGVWPFDIGVVTDLFKYVKVNAANTAAVVCGPPVMYKFVVNKFLELGVPDNQIFMTLERKMKCGMGKCGQCVVGHKYVCVDGPVFTLWDVKNIRGLI
ncbi:MAG TPA: oxidoreductase [candidate division WOR-3 bacterium]|uniref:Oxidoreductase n=1 Tax=candidate division WOR-3 bacterium TaxID=2052148 RepID=A0A7V0Q6D5_UNCW3|nr:MAG: oxidoreductase [Candidatus Hydrothermae bacterium]HDL60235.1 oxidoreductase [candidate division WOR-3 bacterium]